MTSDSSASRAPVLRWRDVLLGCAVALFTFANAWLSIQETPFGVAPDEWAHATYVHEIATEGRLIPDYANSRILPGRTRGNYLSHPPLYYTLLGLSGRARAWDAVGDYRQYRMLSAAMVALGMFFWMLAGRGLAIPPTWLLAGAAATNAIPMFPFLAGSINSDNMAYLGVALAFCGLVQLRSWPRAALWLGAVGVVTVFLSKATAALFLLVFFAIWALPQLRDPASVLRSRRFLVAMAGAGAIVTAYFACTMAVYGSPFPKAAALYAPAPPADPLPIGKFALEFGRQMFSRLATITSHASLSPISGKLEWVFWVMLAAPLLAYVAGPRRKAQDQDAFMAKAFMAALAIAVAAHIVFVWRTHLSAGVLAGMQPRYYSYALPGLFLFGFLRSRDHISGKALFAVFTLAAALLLGVAPSLATRAQIRAQNAAATGTQVVKLSSRPASRLTAEFSVGRSQGGYVDSLEVKGRSAHGSGWAINRAKLASAHGVTVLLDDRVIASIGTGEPRPDVAKSLKSPRAGDAGFKFRIDGLPPGTRPCDLRFAAAQGDGSLSFLAHPGCERK